MGKIRHELWTFCKAELSASAASIVDFGLAVGLTYSHVLSYGYANIIGVVSGGLTNFMLNSHYVFAKTGRNTRSLALRYFMVWAGSMLLNGGGTNLVTYLLGGARWFIFVKCGVALCVAFCFNYPLQRGFVFKKKVEPIEPTMPNRPTTPTMPNRPIMPTMPTEPITPTNQQD